MNPRLGDFGGPSSQQSNAPASGPWLFTSAAADNFILSPSDSSVANYRITKIQAYIILGGEGWDGETPETTMDGIVTYVFDNSIIDQPNGVPNNQDAIRLMDGTYESGSIYDACPKSWLGAPVVAMYWTPLSQFTNTYRYTEEEGCADNPLFSPCPRWAIEYPVNFILLKNTKYWLSVVAVFPAPPQAYWGISNTLTGSTMPAYRGSSFDVLFWTEIEGNDGWDGSEPGVYKNLAFDIYGKERYLA